MPMHQIQLNASTRTRVSVWLRREIQTRHCRDYASRAVGGGLSTTRHWAEGPSPMSRIESEVVRSEIWTEVGVWELHKQITG
jgi:hypothetical protein